MSSASVLLERLLPRCTFPPRGESVTCALSGGPDSTALVALAVAGGLDVTAVHVHHGLRESADDDAAAAERIAGALGAPFRCEYAMLHPGPNLEARARAARRDLIGADAATGHTADDQAETLLLSLIRGSGATGLAAMRPGPTHPILGLRRNETRSVCSTLGLRPVSDPSNDDRRFRRNRVRHELMVLLDDIAERDVGALLARSADLLRADDDLLDELASSIDPTDAKAVTAAPAPLARRAVRRWLTVEGYPPDAAAIQRVLDVAAGRTDACEITGGRRITRSNQRLSHFHLSS